MPPFHPLLEAPVSLTYRTALSDASVYFYFFIVVILCSSTEASRAFIAGAMSTRSCEYDRIRITYSED